MGEKQNRPFHFSFSSSLKVGFQGSRITLTPACCWFESWMSG
jgi:hypothetical protein